MKSRYTATALAISLAPLLVQPGHAVSAQRPAPQWSLSAEPLSTIGGGTDPAAALTRVVSVARLHDGRVLVWEPRPASVRLFGANGRFVRIFAREGSGPGEVRDAIWIGLQGDTVLIADRTQRRLTRYSRDGVVLSTEPFAASGSEDSYMVIGRWQDGTFVLRGFDPGFMGRGGDGVRRDSVWIALAEGAGESPRRLVRFPGAAAYLKSTPNGGVFVTRQPFGPDGMAAASRDLVWVGDNATTTVTGYGRQGQPRRVTVPFRSRPVERRAVDARRERDLGGAQRDAVRALITATYAAAAKTTPYYSGLAVAPNGDLWVTGYVSFDSDRAEVAILSPDGTRRATLHLPPRFRLVQVDDSVVTGIHRDEDGAEFVQVYAIRR